LAKVPDIARIEQESLTPQYTDLFSSNLRKDNMSQICRGIRKGRFLETGLIGDTSLYFRSGGPQLLSHCWHVHGGGPPLYR
jgi:hypothetical protein